MKSFLLLALLAGLQAFAKENYSDYVRMVQNAKSPMDFVRKATEKRPVFERYVFTQFVKKYNIKQLPQVSFENDKLFLTEGKYKASFKVLSPTQIEVNGKEWAYSAKSYPSVRLNTLMKAFAFKTASAHILISNAYASDPDEKAALALMAGLMNDPNYDPDQDYMKPQGNTPAECKTAMSNASSLQIQIGLQKITCSGGTTTLHTIFTYNSDMKDSGMKVDLQVPRDLKKGIKLISSAGKPGQKISYKAVSPAEDDNKEIENTRPMGEDAATVDLGGSPAQRLAQNKTIDFESNYDFGDGDEGVYESYAQALSQYKANELCSQCPKIGSFFSGSTSEAPATIEQNMPQAR